ncbi:MAG TPA: 23S rRNA (pseudouridine(1915)-N(3))-methyltransferase RlmH [Prolixibacteraceae bacterium]|nr:23S rRNA (pseudouridine(1915)-N(3))-methyltransferase RlmH [Prolixibacteraceae bacterium]
MKVTLLVVGKTDESYLKEGIDQYTRRLKHYVNFQVEVIADIKRRKNITEKIQQQKEGEAILAKMGAGKEMHLFDEKGKMFTSREFAGFLQEKMLKGIKELVLVIGGPYGFSDEVHQKAASKIALSRMTFSHQMARLLCVEQLYRAFTILNGEPYHHD